MHLSRSDFYDETALFERLTKGVERSGRPVTLLLGAGITAPPKQGEPGILNVAGVVDLIRSEFDGDTLKQLDDELANSESRYQTAFAFLLGNRGQDAANAIIKKAVWHGRRPAFSTAAPFSYQPSDTTSDDACRALENDYEGWALTPAARAVGTLIKTRPVEFGETLLTTNFDPMIAASIGAAGGSSFRTVLHQDGNFSQTDGTGCHIIHLHGYWYGSDTLHTPRQLMQPRPRLKASLAHLINRKTIVVSGYGGWDDVFTDALMEIVLDDQSFPEIVWTFRDVDPSLDSRLIQKLEPGLNRGRISFYAGIDGNSFFPRLVSSWSGAAPPVKTDVVRLGRDPLKSSRDSRPVRGRPNFDFDRGDQDRPPEFDIYIGRQDELQLLSESHAKVKFLTGIGGQGKSAVAAHYFDSEIASNRFQFRIWRDCKEESERFENQVISLVRGLGHQEVGGAELSKQPMEDLVDLMVALAEDISILVVFDNVDHYVDLELERLAGSAGKFVDRLLTHRSNIEVVFTCRPRIAAEHENVLSSRLEGLDPASARELFRRRGARATEESILTAHERTRGHAFWLDLLAAQVAKRDLPVEDLLDDFSEGETGEIPAATLQSIWAELGEREQIVLRGLAETVRPTTELQLSNYLIGKIRYNKLTKAVASLRALNLIVIKPAEDHQRLLELHPLVRAFVRRTFAQADRVSFIQGILNFYAAFFGMHKAELSLRPSFEVLCRWTEGAELYIEAGNFKAAFSKLYDSRSAFKRCEYPGEFCRVARKLFGRMDWAERRDYREFEEVFEAHFDILALLGRVDECKELLERYEESLEGKDARYIQFCDLNCYFEWVNGNFLEAIKWGAEGAELKAKTNVDTDFDTGHNLALAQRDSGAIDPALTYFLHGVKLEDVTDPEKLEAERGGAFYGNIGRCLQMMGQIEPALNCLRKSARLIDQSPDADHVANQAYARQWIAELLMSKGQAGLARIFFHAAIAKWRTVSPPKARRLEDVLLQLDSADEESRSDILSEERSERLFLQWLDQDSN